MCIVPALIGKAVGGRTGAIIGGGLGGGIPGALGASMLFNKDKSNHRYGSGPNSNGAMS